MKFSAILTTALVSFVAAAPSEARDDSSTSVAEGGDVFLETSEAGHKLDKRIEPITMTILTAAAGSLASLATTEAYNAIKGQSKNLANWNSAREAFTKETVANMWARRRNDREAAVCYNLGYDVSKPKQMRDNISVKFKSGVLNTDYDFFYMSGPSNHFWSRGNGSFINLAIMHNSQFCTFDRKTSDLFCK